MEWPPNTKKEIGDLIINAVEKKVSTMKEEEIILWGLKNGLIKILIPEEAGEPRYIKPTELVRPKEQVTKNGVDETYEKLRETTGHTVDGVRV